tara:strand:+ start:603 stop:941 length:339 start_codon:yes stop_codon:yes gene_type:complete
MSAGTYNITIDQGSDFSLTFTISDGGSAKNLSTYSVRGDIRKKKEDSSPAVQFTGSVVTAASGIAKVVLTNTQTKNLTEGLYFYDIEIFTASDAEVIRILQGTANVTREITR